MRKRNSIWVFKPLYQIESAEEGRDIAIDYQNWACDRDLYMSELADAQEYFELMAGIFPELKDEFVENAII